MKRWLIVAVVTLVILVLLLSGCRHSQDWLMQGTKLEFDSLTAGYMGVTECEEPQIIILGSKPTELQVESLSFYDKLNILSVDYSQYFVLSASYGQRPIVDSKIIITDIWQKNTTVYVRAQFVRNLSIYSAPVMENNPSHPVQINKENMSHFGKLTFVLLDDYFKERARTTAVIQSPEAKK